MQTPTVAELSKQFATQTSGNRIARDLSTKNSLWSNRIAVKFPITAATHYAGDPVARLQKLTRLWQLANESKGDASKAVQEQIKQNTTEASAVTAYCVGFRNELEDGDLKTFLDAFKAFAQELKG